jgi:hypothetical protein
MARKHHTAIMAALFLTSSVRILRQAWHEHRTGVETTGPRHHTLVSGAG